MACRVMRRQTYVYGRRQNHTNAIAFAPNAAAATNLTFHNFTALPHEVRTAIWKFAAAPTIDQADVVDISFRELIDHLANSQESTFPGLYEAMLQAIWHGLPEAQEYWTQTFGMLSACLQSRKGVLKKWYALVDGIDETQEKLVLQGSDLGWVWEELEREFRGLLIG